MHFFPAAYTYYGSVNELQNLLNYDSVIFYFRISNRSILSVILFKFSVTSFIVFGNSFAYFLNANVYSMFFGVSSNFSMISAHLFSTFLFKPLQAYIKTSEKVYTLFSNLSSSIFLVLATSTTKIPM